ncbi:MAG: hypothetical protein ACKO5K_01905 [Armatimonadota bacterium]
MVKVIRSGRRGTLLVGSDLSSLQAARREVADWARSRGIALPTRPLRLSVAEDGMVLREYTVFESRVDPGPGRPARRFATSTGTIAAPAEVTAA